MTEAELEVRLAAIEQVEKGYGRVISQLIARVTALEAKVNDT